jgi:hypothetical protein
MPVESDRQDGRFPEPAHQDRQNLRGTTSENMQCRQIRKHLPAARKAVRVVTVSQFCKKNTRASGEARVDRMSAVTGCDD